MRRHPLHSWTSRLDRSGRLNSKLHLSSGRGRRSTQQPVEQHTEQRTEQHTGRRHPRRGRLRAVALVAGLGLAFASVTAVAGPTVASADPVTGFVTVGHRGSGGLAPENTLAALDLGSQQQPDMMEFDVQLSSDGKPFLFHDATPARTTDAATVFPARVNDSVTTFSWAELQQLDAGSWFSPAFAGEKIPQLSQVPDHLGTVGAVIEIKDPATSPGIEQVIADTIAADPRWDALLDQGKLMVTSFDADSLQRMHALRPDIPMAHVGPIPATDAELDAKAEWADELVTNYRLLDPADIQRVHDAGMRLCVYTVDSPEHLQEVMDLGVDTVMTDFPGVLEDMLAGIDPLPDANGISIQSVTQNPSGDDVQPENGEFLVLTNTSSVTVDVSGYSVHDAVINQLKVGAGYQLAPGAQLRIYTGPGTNTSTKYYNGRTKAVLNNDGDSLAVFDGDTLLDLYAYK